jgi:prepilin-type N-terminal cleavage/methylation domain-containing protein/prepilin-type processing-associated H-X9-DG protein
VKNRRSISGSELWPHAAERRKAAFTLMELLVAVAVMAILAALLLPALSRARESARNVNCLSNLKQLQLCWQMYADDYAGVFVPNDWIATEGSGATNAQDFAQTSWCDGDARMDAAPSNIQKGLLFPYNTSTAIYHCPSDLSTIQDTNGNPLPQLRTRSYNMSQSVNGYPFLSNSDNGYLVDVLQPCFASFDAITNPPPCQLFVFIDENEVTLLDDQFGYPSPGWGTEWWDMPSNRHSQGANLSFTDGHVEHWRWQAPMIPAYPAGYVQPVPPEQMPDFTRVGNAMRQKAFDGAAD